jgi:hypothetical protein
VQFGDDTFVLSLHNREPATEKIKTVRGITIKRDELPMHQWLGALSDALSAEANRSEEARLALERILS